MKKLFLAFAFIGSFGLGMMSIEPIKDARKYFHYEIAKGFYEQPYNLKIEIRENLDGKLEAYLTDQDKKIIQKIGPNLYVGNYKHRVKSVINIPKEMSEKNKALKFIFEIYSLIFDK